MRALVKQAKGPGNMSLMDVEEPRVGPGQVKVKVAHAGICGTDVHIASGEFFHYFPPLVLGHEFSGEVVETGNGVEGIPLGARVTAEPTKSTCRVCPHCTSGRYNRCEERDIAGVVSNGAFTDYVVTRAESIHRLPDNVSLKAAALSEPLAVCVHGMCEQCCVREGDFVLVMGPGAIGLGCAQVALSHGARVMVAGAGKDVHRLALARSFGAKWAVNVEKECVLERVMEETNGWGADLAVEAAGAPGVLEVCVEAVRKGGEILQVGLPVAPVAVDMGRLAFKEIRLVGTFGQKRSAWLLALELLETGRVDSEAMVSDMLPLDAWERGFDIMRRGAGLKVLLAPAGQSNDLE